MDNAGSVRFKPAAEGPGTDVTVTLQYNPPGGALGAQVARWLGDDLERKIDEGLQRFKETMEAKIKAR